MTSWVMHFWATVPGWPVTSWRQASWRNDVRSYQCTPGHAHATEQNQVANRNKPGFVSVQPIRTGVMLHQKHEFIGLEFWMLHQARYFCISPDFSLLKSGLIRDGTMESCTTTVLILIIYHPGCLVYWPSNECSNIRAKSTIGNSAYPQ
jgi:hypothetical protein